MDKFIVSARKYRPQTFDTVVGQQHITTTLKNAIKNKQLAHAFLFCGPRGVGKTTCARILAKTINCENLQPDGEACNECNSCKSFNEGTSLNIHELDAASNNSVDDIRTLVEQVRFMPQAGKYKVYIVDEVHMLSASAFNAFLKTLEEPPPYAIFILATTEKHKILPTILSRCQIFDFKRITTNDTVEHLQEIADKENIKAEKSALQIIAQKSEGCMRDALSILDKIVSFTNGEVNYRNTLEHLNILDEDYYFKLLDSLLQQDIGAAMLLYDEINSKGFEGDMVLNGFAEFLRNLLVSKNAKAASLLEVVEGMQEKYIAKAEQVSMSYLVSALNILNEFEINYKMARNKRLHVELALIKLNYLQQALELVIENGNVVKKKRVDAPVIYKSKTIEQTPGAPVKKTEAKVIIQQPAKEKIISPPQPASPKAANTVKEPSVKYAAPKNGNGKNLLEALREKVGADYNVEEVKDAEPLTQERLNEVWNDYAATLEAQPNKHSTYQTFRIAKLNVETDNFFTVTVHALTQQKFIEQEKTLLCDFIQRAFYNRSINFKILIEAGEEEEVPIYLTLNSRQKFDRIAEKYPLVKELKNRLNLDIDY
ncbi:DNA polymerase III subunit gamma/tau [Parafilimonas terrae]|uniref:DNA polymerase III subunit gamma/tau n=1 Tax=Parafilimonas terrae TaxID=1465490 RepID=A0A1I5WUH8_9BACT|nr:DNA polymerase III subunit gamma/tau [Parafilimonas terrae]SFQ23359.1 DNA polymerase-3 subunit gamma/tau [Parafilimonas terrae]